MDRSRRRYAGGWLLIAAACFVCGCSGAQGKQVSQGGYAGYNVLLVSFDALQAGHTGCLGYSRNTTPTIDTFARRGFLFKNAVSQAPWTVPAHMSWFTSLYPSQHKCVNKYSTYNEKETILTNLKKLSPDVVTLAEVLQENGFATGGFTGDAGVSDWLGFSQGFDTFFNGERFGGMDKSIPEALGWLRKNRGKKFFLFLHGYDCHGQYDPPGGYDRRFVDFDYRGPLKGGKEEQGMFREEGLEKGHISLGEDDVRFWRALYDEKISDADALFGEFIREFGKMGLLDKTVVIIASDHGTEFYEHKRFDHGFSLYDELIHVPLVVWFPGMSKGAVIEDQVRSIDIMPTLVDLLGLKVSAKVEGQMKGVSLVPLMKGGHADLDAFSETDYRFYAHKRSIRTNSGWKFIYSLDTRQKELYNLKEDPRELNNLAGKEPAVAGELEQKLLLWMKSMGQDEDYPEKLLRDVIRIKEY